jgi:hypothetical protein
MQEAASAQLSLYPLDGSIEAVFYLLRAPACHADEVLFWLRA